MNPPPVVLVPFGPSDSAASPISSSANSSNSQDSGSTMSSNDEDSSEKWQTPATELSTLHDADATSLELGAVASVLRPNEGHASHSHSPDGTASPNCSSRVPCRSNDCSESYSNKRAEQRHYRQVHLRPFPCTFLGCQVRSFGTSNGRKRHFRTAHVKDMAACPHSGCSYQNVAVRADNMIRHLATHRA